jgi:uncharacterized protein
VIGDMVVVDAVVHPYNLDAGNRAAGAEPQLEAVYAAHEMATRPDQKAFRLSREEFFIDFPFDAMARALFLESRTDMAVIHALPNLGFANDYVTDPRRAAEFRDRHPGRFLLYATVDTPILASAISQVEWQVRELGVDGLKLYPSFFYDGMADGWRLDGEDFATPLLEAARDLGIRNVAIHKALWLPPAPPEAFRVDDLDSPLDRFPEINFQIVHAGMAFLEQTCELLGRHPNLYATLESTFAYSQVKPRLFAEVLGGLLVAAGSERLMYGSGTNLMHPRPILDAFETFEMPPDLVEQRGYPELSDRDRRNILGENLLRLHAIAPETVRERTAADAFDLGAETLAAPWSGVRSMQA